MKWSRALVVLITEALWASLLSWNLFLHFAHGWGQTLGRFPHWLQGIKIAGGIEYCAGADRVAVKKTGKRHATFPMSEARGMKHEG